MAAGSTTTPVRVKDDNGDTQGSAANPLRTDPTGSTTQPISAASLPLPAGAATEATLAAISTNTPAVGQTTMAASSPVTIASDQTAVASKNAAASQVDGHSSSIGATTDADTANTVIGRLKQVITRLAGGLPAALVGGRLDSNIGAWLGSTAPTVAQKAMAASVPVVVASDQTAVASKNAAASQVDGHSSSIGATTDADTANTVIGRLKQQVTKLAGGLPAALVGGRLDINLGSWLGATTPTVGQKAMAASIPVAMASNQTATPTKIEDGQGSGRLAAVDSSYRLLVSANATVIPPASVAVEVEAISSLTGTADSVYVVPSAKQLTITRFAGGSEGNSGKVSKVSLFYDPAGTGTGMTLIRAMYLGTTNWEFGLDYKVLGDGTKAIRMRRERLDGAADEVAGFWSGFRDV